MRKTTLSKLWRMGLSTASIEEIKPFLNGLINDALSTVEEARTSVAKGNFLNAAVSLSLAIDNYKMYTKLKNKIDLDEEIATEFENVFWFEMDTIKEAIKGV